MTSLIIIIMYVSHVHIDLKFLPFVKDVEWNVIDPAWVRIV